MEQWPGSKLRKEYTKAVYCHLSYLTYMQSTLCEILSWKNDKLESILPGEIAIISDMQMTSPFWHVKGKVKGNYRDSMKVKEESEKASLKLKIPKTKIMASGPITSWQIDGETIETETDYFLGFQNQCRW